MKSLSEALKNHFHEVARTKTSTKSLAFGFACGTFIAILPTPGFNILLGLLIVFLFKRISKFSLFVAMAFWNPLVVSPLYVLSLKFGNVLFAGAPVVKFDVVILNTIYNFTRRFLIANLIIAFVMSLVSFSASYLFFNWYKKKHGKV